MSDLSATTGTWVIDPTHTVIGFTVRHAMVAKVRGRFNEFSGSFTLDGANPANSKAEITIQTASFDTQNADRDAHVKSADFLDVENFPTMTFTSTSVAAKSDTAFVVTGDLTIRGTTKSVPVTFELLGTSKDPWGGTRIGFEGEGEINRKEYNLTWNVALETGGVLVSENVKLTLDVEAVKQEG
jgi:polyisoprenoid-binding protein YceI